MDNIPKLSIAASNRDRLQLDSPISQWFMKSIQWQIFKDIELVIADGGSENYEELKDYFENNDFEIPMRIVQHKIGDFSRSFLNNFGIRNGVADYRMTTDVDMIFGKDFCSELMSMVGDNVMVESRTMYLKSNMTQRIYSGELDPYNDIDGIKRGRVKKRTTAGGCQCMHINSWKKLHGFNEEYQVWGSEDTDLCMRAKMAGLKVKWMGEPSEDVMLFHQAHKKDNVKRDLEFQDNVNKPILAKLRRSRQFVANPSGYWGGIKD